VVESMALRRFRSESGEVLLDVPRAPLPDASVPAPVRFLPTWDAILLAHARRTLVLAEEDRPRIFNTKMPQSIGTFTVDGQVAGTWRFDPKAGLATQPFAALPPADATAVVAEAERFAAFHARERSLRD
jgi:hypothetical protein